jgi:uncharacterized protein YbjT (DUF2867 family)
MILVVGATGILGEEVCHQLVAAGHPVAGLVRKSSDAAKLARLKALGVKLIEGDLKDPAALRAACGAARTVISTATSTSSHRDGNSISSVDRDGNLQLVEAARQAGVKHFIFISFPPMQDDFPLQAAKRAAEARIRESGMPYTILQPVNFMEMWLSPVFGFDVANAKARIFGAGQGRNNWISFQDVARFMVAAVDNPKAINQTFAFGGPEALSQLEVVALFEQLTGRTFTLEFVPEEALKAMRTAGEDPMPQTAAGLMLHCSRGDNLDMARVLEALPVKCLTVREFAQRQLAR